MYLSMMTAIIVSSISVTYPFCLLSILLVEKQIFYIVPNCLKHTNGIHKENINFI